MSVDSLLEELEQRGWFVLATNQLNSQALTAPQILETYKNQIQVEKGFRFMNNKEFLTSAIFLKSPKRIEALSMIMTLCLLVYAALGYRIRAKLAEKKATFPNQKGTPIQNPTTRWVFQAFHGIDELLMEGRKIILNLIERQNTLLTLLGAGYRKYHFP